MESGRNKYLYNPVSKLIYLAVHLLNERCATSELTALYFMYNHFLFNCFKSHFKSISISF